MRRLIEFLLAYGTALGFIGLQGVATLLLMTGNLRHSQRFAAAMTVVNGRLEAARAQVTGYFDLAEANALLQAENQRLHSTLLQRQAEVAALRQRTPAGGAYSALPDSLLPRQRYSFIPGRAIGHTTDRNYNYITLNVGRRHGLRPEMGLITPDGVAGLVVAVSDDYAMAMSVLNRDFRLSSRVRARNSFGTLRWDGGRADEALLENIPLHHRIAVGDTVTVSAYSSIFPEGLMVGRVRAVAPDAGGGFHRVTVALSADLSRLDYLYAVAHSGQGQLDSLRRSFATGGGGAGAALPLTLPPPPLPPAQNPARSGALPLPQQRPATPAPTARPAAGAAPTPAPARRDTAPSAPAAPPDTSRRAP